MPYLQVNQTQFYYQRVGNKQGPLVIYLHGLIMDNLSSGYFTFAHTLAKWSDVLLYDLRGHGRSSITPTGYRIQEQVLDLKNILEELSIEKKVTLIGCSFGGTLALAFARTYPQSVESLVLLDGHLYDAHFLDQLRMDLTADEEERNRLIARHFQHWFHRDRKRKRDRLIKRAQKLIGDTSLLEDLKQSALELDQDLSGLRCPILGLYGSESDVLESGQHLAHTLSSYELKIFPNCSHALLWEATQEVIETLNEWLYLRFQSTDQ